MEHELDLLDHLNDTVTRITEDTLLLSLLLDYMDGLSCRPEQVSREISENLLQRLGDSLEQDAGALRRLWQSYGVSGRSRVSPGVKPPCSAHSRKTWLGAWASILTSRRPFSTAIRS